ncbi:lysophospholipid acyltransferase family protein [Paludisphaera borealis]|uniref:1-acyl-sn-glycerol-3-phosphate acyltransferase n=1 Tax=Paludisphaera borealis TaxID=1387353 RepID=A0A1U7CLK6_9BACT|nr:lysophospholipid acyltransferase family protein [Paludisphaera borealis]APW59788.1 1-acyl-sn-glycerol-3-phosphate acyltransferase [Paludisphaera borealis]
MNSWVSLALTALLLALPRVLMTRGEADAAARIKPEIHGDLAFYWWVIRFYTWFWHRLQHVGWAPLPETGPAVLISNHTCCIDHLLLQSSCRRVLGFMIAREFFELPIVHAFCVRVGCIPVNRDGRDLQAIRVALRALDEGKVLPIFPEGKVTANSGRTLGPMLPGAAFIAVRSGAPVIPAYIYGSPLTDDIAQSLLWRSRARVRFGPPIDMSDIKPSQAGDKNVLARVSDRFERALLELQAQCLEADPEAGPETVETSTMPARAG